MGNFKKIQIFTVKTRQIQLIPTYISPKNSLMINKYYTLMH